MSLGLAEHEFLVVNPIGFARDARVFVPYTETITGDTVFTANGKVCLMKAGEDGVLVIVEGVPAYGVCVLRAAGKSPALADGKETGGMALDAP